MIDAIGKIVMLLGALAITGFFAYLLVFGDTKVSENELWGLGFVCFAMWVATFSFWGKVDIREHI